MKPVFCQSYVLGSFFIFDHFKVIMIQHGETQLTWKKYFLTKNEGRDQWTLGLYLDSPPVGVGRSLSTKVLMNPRRTFSDFCWSWFYYFAMIVCCFPISLFYKESLLFIFGLRESASHAHGYKTAVNQVYWNENGCNKDPSRLRDFSLRAVHPFRVWFKAWTYTVVNEINIQDLLFQQYVFQTQPLHRILRTQTSKRKAFFV